MQLTQPITVIGLIFAAAAGYAAFGGATMKNILESRKAHTCDHQVLEKTTEAGITADGSVSYDKANGICTYDYTDAEGQPAKLTWEP